MTTITDHLWSSDGDVPEPPDALFVERIVDAYADEDRELTPAERIDEGRRLIRAIERMIERWDG